MRKDSAAFKWAENLLTNWIGLTGFGSLTRPLATIDS